MKNIKALIADDSITLCQELSKFLIGKEQIESCDIVQNGIQLLKMVKENTYDIILLDLVLPQLDGFSILEELCRMQQAPKTIVMSAISQDAIIRRVCDLGASYYVIKPFSFDTLYKRIVETVMPGNSANDISMRMGRTIKTRTLDERIANVFLTIGIPAHIKGYNYLREAVKEVYKNWDIISSITKELYPVVAKRFDTTPSKVERAIRHAIDISWQRGKLENINALFGYVIYGENDRPTNGEFIALIAEKLVTEDTSQAQAV